MKRLFLFLMISALALSPFAEAFAGANPLTVATRGRGIAVYTASSGGRQAGTLYNGFNAELSLSPENGLYACMLTHEYTVWLDKRKAEQALPREWHLGPSDEALDAQVPCGIFLAEVTAQDAPLYASPARRHLKARHAPGTLALACGEFGDSYYVMLGSFELSGFMPKAALRQVKPLTYAQTKSEAWGVEGAVERTVYTGGVPLMRSGSATGCSDIVTYWQLKDGDRVTVLATPGGVAQLAYGGFIEGRFLEPDGDHSRVYATVVSDKPLNRLNVRSFASKEAAVVCKLFAGARVQVIDHTDDWASIVVSGKGANTLYTGAVQTQYLDFGGQGADSAFTAVRTRCDLGAGNGGDWYRLSWDRAQGVLPAGTALTVIGVAGSYDAAQDEPDRLLCLTEEGRLVTLFEDGVLEVTETLGIQAKAASAVRLRSTPSKAADVAARIPRGGRVTVLLRGEGWTMVAYEGQTGYVMSRYLSFP